MLLQTGQRSVDCHSSSQRLLLAGPSRAAVYHHGGQSAHHWRHQHCALSRPAPLLRRWRGACTRQLLPPPAAATAVTALAAEGWPLWAALASSGAVAQVLSSSTPVGTVLSPPLLSLACGAALALAGVLPLGPGACAGYDVVWSYLMPLAAACFLLETDVAGLITQGGPTAVAFVIGALGMITGALVGLALLGPLMGPHALQMASCLCASYVGGSVNFAAVAQAVSLPSVIMPAVVATDNASMAVFLALLMAVPSPPLSPPAANAAPTAPSPAAAPLGGSSAGPLLPAPALAGAPAVTAAASAGGSGVTAAAAAEAAVSVPSAATFELTTDKLAVTLAAAAMACAMARLSSEAVGAPPLMLLALAIICTAMASAATAVGNATGGPAAQAEGHAGSRATTGRRSRSIFAGSGQLGAALMMPFFTVIGASAASGLSGGAAASVSGGVFSGMWLFAFLVVMVAVHWAVLWLVGGVVLRLPFPALVVGSNANIGGPATAAGLAATRGWPSLVQPALMTATLGYAVGTAAGLTVSRLAGG